MSVAALDLGLLRLASTLLLGGGVPLLFVALARAHRSALGARLSRYERELGRDLAFLRVTIAPRTIVVAQGSVLLVMALLALFGAVLPASLCLMLALSVQPVVRARRARRASELDLQLDAWLRGLASSLRATPALGEAIEHSISLVTSPLRDELDHLVKELKLGIGLDEAVQRMGTRVQSRTLETALATLRIGRNTGGDVPEVLERSATSLREMARLEGVLRTKTAEGKAQTFVLAVLPFPLIGLLHFLNAGFLQPLFSGTRGHVVLGAALVLWASSILLARRILRVDL
jgi:tight adherence protein B